MDRLIARALTLQERLDRARDCLPAPSRGPNRKTRLESCKRWFDSSRSDSSNWTQFLEDIGIGEFDLTNLATDEDFQGPWPKWVLTLRRLFEALKAESARARRSLSAAENMAVPVVRFAWSELACTLPNEQFRLLSPPASGQLRKALLARLAGSAKGVADWECSLPSERPLFQDRIGAATAAILWRYPALAGLWAKQVSNWGQSVADFLERALRFLRDYHGPRSDAVRIRALVPELSDLHNGNRTVFRLRLTDGTTWFYKPRSGQQERGWFALLGWLQEQGFPFPFKIPRLICAADHCWMEGVPPRPCSDRNEVRTYYFRAGALLYLAHLLRGVDFHAGNVLACGGDPVFVDCETLLHPRTRVPQFVGPQQRGVLRTGLLPVKTDDDPGADNVSGFGRRSAGAHLVRFHGRPARGQDFVEEIVRGFQSMHKFLNRDRHKSLVALAARHLPKAGRRIYRPTSYYHSLLTHSLAPRLMISGFDRSLYLHAACRNSMIVPRRHLQREVAALEVVDVPLLTGRIAQVREPLSASAVRQSVRLIRAAF